MTIVINRNCYYGLPIMVVPYFWVLIIVAFSQSNLNAVDKPMILVCYVVCGMWFFVWRLKETETDYELCKKAAERGNVCLNNDAYCDILNT